MEDKDKKEGMKPQDWVKRHLTKNKDHSINDLYWGLNFTGCYKCDLYHAVGWGNVLTKCSTD